MIICADDFGIAADVDQSILTLASEQKISAVSIMAALLPGTTPALRELLQRRATLDLGLHLMLTGPGRPSGPERADSLSPAGQFLSPAALLQQCLCRQIGIRDARDHIAAQYRRFVELCGFAPDFLDGHLHVHQFPGIRDGLLAFMAEFRTGAQPYIRNTHEPVAAILQRGVAPLKSWGIGVFGRTLARRLIQQGIPTNSGFGGICDYRRWSEYPRCLSRFIRHARRPNDLIMVHPGLQEAWRKAEYNGLQQVVFPPNQPSRFSFAKQADELQNSRCLAG